MLTVSRLSVTPVRGLALLHPEEVELTPLGPIDDRRYSLCTPDGEVFDGTDDGTLVQIRAELLHDPERLVLTFPDGSVVSGEVALGERRTVEIYGRPFPARPVNGPWAEALSGYLKRAVTLMRAERDGDARDRHPVSIVSEASVEELSRQAGLAEPLDARRFRMLVQVAGGRPLQEDEWIGRAVRLGEALVRVTERDARCVITTQSPETGLRDFPTLHAIKAYRGLRNGRHLDFGVYADVREPGLVRVGDAVEPDSSRARSAAR